MIIDCLKLKLDKNMLKKIIYVNLLILHVIFKFLIIVGF